MLGVSPGFVLRGRLRPGRGRLVAVLGSWAALSFLFLSLRSARPSRIKESRPTFNVETQAPVGDKVRFPDAVKEPLDQSSTGRGVQIDGDIRDNKSPGVARNHDQHGVLTLQRNRYANKSWGTTMGYDDGGAVTTGGGGGSGDGVPVPQSTRRLRPRHDHRSRIDPRHTTISLPGLILEYDYSRPAYFPWRTVPDECVNYATRFLVGGRLSQIALVSHPGSGNTWLRFVVETVTGVFTGSVYHDEALALKGFWGERDGYRLGTTLLQKTHSLPLLPEELDEGGIYHGREFRLLVPASPRRVVMLLRSPWEALIALRHYHVAGHTGFASRDYFTGPDWVNFTLVRAAAWIRLHSGWLALPDTSLHVIHYENLQEDLEKEMADLLHFLGLPLDFGRIECLSKYPEGRFRRPKYPRHLQGYSFPVAADFVLTQGVANISRLLQERGLAPIPKYHYALYPIMQEPHHSVDH